MNSLMTSRSLGGDGGHSVCSSLLSVAALAGAVCGGEAEEESIVCSPEFCDHCLLCKLCHQRLSA